MSAIGRATHTTKWIPVKDISVVWANTQRPFHKKWAQHIADNFDPDMFGTLSVSVADKNGTYHCVDGQHRRAAVETLWGKDEKVPCHVFDAESPERAAQIFDTMNTSRKTLQALEVFAVRVTGKVEPEFSVHKIIAGLGYKVSTVKQDGNIAAVSACVSVYKRYGEDVLLRSLLLIRETWGRTSTSVDGTMVRGFAEFVAKYGRNLDTSRFKQKVAKQYTPSRLIGAAKSANELFRGGVSRQVCNVLLNTYNHGLKKGRLE